MSLFGAACTKVSVEESTDPAPGVLGGGRVVLGPGDTTQEPEEQRGVGGIVVVHEAVADAGVDLHVVRHHQGLLNRAIVPAGTRGHTDTSPDLATTAVRPGDRLVLTASMRSWIPATSRP